MRTLAFLAVLVAAPAAAQDDARSAIEARNERFMAAFAAANADSIAALYTDDAHLYAPNAPDQVGPEAIGAYFQGALSNGLTRLDLQTEEVDTHGDRAYEVGRFTLYAGDEAVDSGRYMVTWALEGGRWFLHRDIYNSERPAP